MHRQARLAPVLWVGKSLSVPGTEKAMGLQRLGKPSNKKAEANGGSLFRKWVLCPVCIIFIIYINQALMTITLLF